MPGPYLVHGQQEWPGRLDPQTGKITVYKMPDLQAKDPTRSSSTGRHGMVHASAEQHDRPSRSCDRRHPACHHEDAEANRTGSRKTPAVRCGSRATARPALQGRSGDDGTHRSAPAACGHNGAAARHRADGMIWYVNSGMGRLGRYNPQTGEIKEASPSGPKSHPMRSSSWTASSGTTSRACDRMPWCGLIPRPKRSRAGRFLWWRLCRHHPPHAWRDGSLLIHLSSTNRIIQVTVQGRTARR